MRDLGEYSGGPVQVAQPTQNTAASTVSAGFGVGFFDPGP